MKKLRIVLVSTDPATEKRWETEISYRTRQPLHLGAKLTPTGSLPLIVKAHGWEGDRFYVHVDAA